MTDNPYLDAYQQQWAHELSSDPSAVLREQPQPEGMDGARRTLTGLYAWAVPDPAALDAITRYSPRGVVELGAGGGYWAGLLRAHGVDVVAYDPDPAAGRWSPVRAGDHTAVAAHPDRTLLLVWPSYEQSWTGRVLDLYAGDTVIYVGAGGVTGSDRMHALLGVPCWHVAEDEPCTCAADPAVFEQVGVVAVPQWYGVPDRLSVHHRIPVLSTVDTIG